MKYVKIERKNYILLIQEKKVVVADPDILSFNINDHKMKFAGNQVPSWQPISFKMAPYKF